MDAWNLYHGSPMKNAEGLLDIVVLDHSTLTSKGDFSFADDGII